VGDKQNKKHKGKMKGFSVDRIEREESKQKKTRPQNWRGKSPWGENQKKKQNRPKKQFPD